MLLQLASAAFLITLASLTAYYGAWLSHSRELAPGVAPVASASVLDALDVQTITWQHACMLPLFASIVLALMFFAFQWIDWFLVLYLLGVSCFATAFTAYTAQRHLLGLHQWSSYISIALGVATSALWAATGSPLAIDVVGVCISLMCIQTIRLPSVKVGAIALLGLLIYDVYWVFISVAHFKENVMVAVASQRGSNPMHAAAAAIPGMAQYLPPPKLDMPNKLMIPVFDWAPDGAITMQRYMMLGLGDIVVPALVLALARKLDCQVLDAADGPPAPSASASRTDDNEAIVELEAGAETEARALLRSTPASVARPPVAAAGVLSQAQPRFLAAGMVGYVSGLLLALVMSTLFEAAQPALLYLVPCVFASLFAYAASRGWGSVIALWNGQAIAKESD